MTSTTFPHDSIIMLGFGKISVQKETIYDAKRPMNMWDISVDNIVISKSTKTQKRRKNLSYKTISLNIT